MRFALFALIIQLTFPLMASAQEKQSLQLYNAKTKAYDSLQFVKIDKVWVSEACAKNKNCDALKTLKTKVQMKKTESPLLGNPGSTYCLSQKGVARILKDAKGNEYDYCLFNDGSLIDSWNLYYAHHGQ